MKINEDFKFRDELSKDKKDTVPIELLTGIYKGVILRYTTVDIKEDVANDQATLKFQYELLEMGNHTETQLRKDKVFNEYIGLVLNALIVEAIDAIEEHDNESRKDDSKELIEE
jgi:hypothetical protein